VEIFYTSSEKTGTVTSMLDPAPPQAPQFLLDAVRRVVTPVVRLLLHFGIT